MPVRAPEPGASVGDADRDQADSQTDIDYNLGAGIEYRFGENGRWGRNGEVRDFISSFEGAGLDSTVHDWVYTVGVTLNY